MNFMEMYLLNRANILSGSISSGSIDGGFPETQGSSDPNTIATGTHSVPFISTLNQRQNSGSFTYSSSFNQQLATPNPGMASDSQIKQQFWFALGDASPATDSSYGSTNLQHLQGHDDNMRAGKTVLQFGKFDQLARAAQMHQYNGSDMNYSPWFSSVLFVKNTTASDISKTVTFFGSSNNNSSYGHMAAATIVPNNVSKVATTGQTTSRFVSYQSQTYGAEQSGSATFPANKTTAIVWTHNLFYWTSFSSGAHWSGNTRLRKVDQLFDGTGLVPDHKMTAVAYQGRSNNFTADQPWRVWKECGDILGDN